MAQLSVDANTENRPNVGSFERDYVWPQSFRITRRPHELSDLEASQLNDFISTEAGLNTRDGFNVVGAALDNIPLRLDSYERRAGDVFNLAFTKTKIYKFVDPNWTDISRGGGYTGNDTDPWSLATVLNYAAATNYIDKIQYWDGTAGTFVDLPAAGGGKSLENVRARYVVQFGGRLWLLNIIEAGPIVNALRVWWSIDQSFANDTDWTGLGSGKADLDLTPDGITGVGRMGRLLVIYKRRSLYHVFETFDINAPFAFDLRVSAGTDKGVGLISGETLVDAGGFHLGLFSDNVYRYDSSSLTGVGDPVIRDVIQSVGPQALRQAVASHHPQQNLYILWVPLAGQAWPENGYVYDYRRDLWVGQIKRRVSSAGLMSRAGNRLKWQDATTIRWQDAHFSWASLAQSTGFPGMIFGSPDDKKVYQMQPTNQYDGPGAEWVTRDEDFGYADRRTGVNRVRLRVVGPGIVGVVGCAVSGDGGRTYSTTALASYSAAAGEQDIFFDLFHVGRRHMFKFTTPKKIQIVEWGARYSLRGRAAA